MSTPAGQAERIRERVSQLVAEAPPLSARQVAVLISVLACPQTEHPQK